MTRDLNIDEVPMKLDIKALLKAVMIVTGLWGGTILVILLSALFPETIAYIGVVTGIAVVFTVCVAIFYGALTDDKH